MPRWLQIGWKVLAAAYALINVGGVPGALASWRAVLQPFGEQRVLGVVLLLVILASLVPVRWWQRIKRINWPGRRWAQSFETAEQAGPPSEAKLPLAGKITAAGRVNTNRELAQRLAPLHTRGQQIQSRLRMALPGSVMESFSGDKTAQLQRERLVRAWHDDVEETLAGHAALSWRLAAQLPEAHPTLGLIEPTTTVHQLADFMDKKLDYLRGVIERLGS